MVGDMDILSCPMCYWTAAVAGNLRKSEEARWVARRVLDMHFDTHVEEFREELEDAC